MLAITYFFISFMCISAKIRISMYFRGGYFNSKTALNPINSTNSSLISITAAATSPVAITDKLTYFQAMAAGAISRTMAQTIMHPANTYKTLLQLRRDPSRNTNMKLSLGRLFQGADAQFLLSLPHGALYFTVIEQVKFQMERFFPRVKPFITDFLASSVSTVVCSVVSTPQMVLTDRLMGGIYSSFPDAVRSILRTEGPRGFYTGWWPALAQKLPSYALTWMFFQQFKRAHEHYLNCKPNSQENFFLGALAAAGSVCVMNPMDTVKTRLVTQMNPLCPKAYKGVTDCFLRVFREEGPGAFYRSLPPRLFSVVPMIAIQFGVYEALRVHILRPRKILSRPPSGGSTGTTSVDSSGSNSGSNSGGSDSNSSGKNSRPLQTQAVADARPQIDESKDTVCPNIPIAPARNSIWSHNPRIASPVLPCGKS